MKFYSTSRTFNKEKVLVLVCAFSEFCEITAKLC